MHLGRNAATMMAPEEPRPFPLKSALVMEASMVTGAESSSPPLKVNFESASLLCVWCKV
jgi:hypothetical protein